MNRPLWWLFIFHHTSNIEHSNPFTSLLCVCVALVSGQTELLSLPDWSIKSVTRTVGLFIHSFIHSLNQSINQSIIHSFIHSFIQIFTHWPKTKQFRSDLATWGPIFYQNAALVQFVWTSDPSSFFQNDKEKLTIIWAIKKTCLTKQPTGPLPVVFTFQTCQKNNLQKKKTFSFVYTLFSFDFQSILQSHEL